MGKRIRWCLADWLSYAACRLRGQEWYAAKAWHGVNGNRAAELEQQIWQGVVILTRPRPLDDVELQQVERDLTELAQMARSTWGHQPERPATRE